MVSDVALNAPGKRVLLLGNEAVARGALEAGVGFASGYPGTPASEVLDTLVEVAKEFPGLVSQYSTNEYVALETAVGASWSGVRALCAMKMVGMNVASDPLFTLCYCGVGPGGGLVIVNGGDPSCISSTNEQDNRYYGLHAHMPVVEPSNPQECKDFTLTAFSISEEFDVPVMLNMTARTSHSLGPVVLGELKPPKEEGYFVKNWGKYFSALVIAVSNKQKLLRNMARLAEDYAYRTPLNRILEGGRRIGIVTSGVSYNYTLEALDMLKLYDVPILKLGLVYPLSKKLVAEFAENLDKIVVMEELEGFLEDELKKIAYDEDLSVKIVGKEIFSPAGELSVDDALVAYSKVFGLDPPINPQELALKTLGFSSLLLMRTPGFCPGCSHRATLYAIKKAVEGKGYDIVWGGDIGCYANASLPPFNMSDFMVCMSAGVSIASGISFKSKKQKAVAFIGDSTFFHTGMPAVLNAVWNNADILIVVMDNGWTAMTGHQPHPGTGLSAAGKAKAVDIAEVCRALGVDYVRVVDPFNLKHAISVFDEAFKRRGVRVVVSRQECVLQAKRRMREIEAEKKRRGIEEFYEVAEHICIFCEECLKAFGCPAIVVGEFEGKKVSKIDLGRCVNCSVCKQLCKGCAITHTKIWKNTSILEEARA
ncbi:MAG: indolepyruvate ferredoxin oxidoreductase subunit alpha [Candidatus Freyarchaeota archaeon]|nr:indolepyruvate ferredoxin oxidoreductase subunit alpha [Candidatus Jordarchaeia archaeon]